MRKLFAKRRLAKGWIKRIEAKQEARTKARLDEAVTELQAAIAGNHKELRKLTAALEMSRLLGRINGLREGMALYEYGQNLQDDNTRAFMAMVKYCANVRQDYPTSEHRNLLSARSICQYLDKTIRENRRRDSALKVEEIKMEIYPPKKWGKGWIAALDSKDYQESVNQLAYRAREESKTENYGKIMDWNAALDKKGQ